MLNLVIPVVASLLLSGVPARADVESETRVEERVEERSDGLTTQRSRMVETERDGDDESTTVRREESIEAGGLGVSKTVEQHVDHDDDD